MRVWLLVATLCTAVVVYFRLTRRDLISQSTRVPGVEFNDDFWPQAAWLDDSHLFALVKGPSLAKQCVSVDVRTGVRKTLATLEGTHIDDGRNNEAQNFVLSPDRSHLLMPGNSFGEWQLTTISKVLAKRLPGGPPIERSWNCSNPWTPDSRTIVSILDALDTPSSMVAMTIQADKPYATSFFTINVAKLPSTAGPAYPEGLLGFEPSGVAVTTTWAPGQVVDVYMASFPIRDNAAARTWAIKIPADSRVDEMVLSPKGDRLLWKLRITRSSVFARLLARLLRTEPPEENTDEIWVSRLDGSGFKKIGGVAVKLNPIFGGGGLSVEEKYPVSQLHWSPNGKMASFVHNRYCYTIAVPED